MFLCWPTSQALAQPSFDFCGFSYDESRTFGGLFDQLKDLDQCKPGKGAVWRVRYDPKRSDASHLAAMICDFSRQILIHEANGSHTVTCVVRDAPRFGN